MNKINLKFENDIHEKKYYEEYYKINKIFIAFQYVGVFSVAIFALINAINNPNNYKNVWLGILY